jgi:hypothetical protein
MRHKVIGGAVVLLALLLPTGATADVIFWLDTPPDGATVAGIVEVSGWILDDGQQCGPPPSWQACEWTDPLVSNIDLYVDGVFIASADLNKPRYDVLQAYPWYAGTPYAKPGFSTSFNADNLTDGTHTLFLRVTFSDATVTNYGTRTVEVDSSINQAPFGELERPFENQPMSNVFPVTGWVLDEGTIEDIEIMVDGLVVGHAVTGIHRPDIGNRFPSHPGANYAGFIRMLNTSEIINGIHILSVRVRDNEGATRVIGRRYVQVSNTGYNLPPFGGLDWPISNHIMLSQACSVEAGVSLPQEGVHYLESIFGWTLDIGASTDRGGVKWVELLIDGSLIANTLVDEFFSYDYEMNVNYYGYERLDIQRMFPDVPNAKHSGFMFSLDVGDLILNHDFHEGLHYCKIRAADSENNVADIAQIPVIFDCPVFDPASGTQGDYIDIRELHPAWGDIYTPTNMEMVSGVTEVTGWAISYRGTWEIEVWVDGEFIEYATHGISMPDLHDQYPWFARDWTRFAGYYYGLDTRNLTDGEHVLVVKNEDRDGFKSIIGERRFVVDNLNKRSNTMREVSR